MPNVPRVPGVPPLSSYGVVGAVLLFADNILSALVSTAPKWGIFRDGVEVVESDSTKSFELKQDLPISNYPVEKGAFQSYNKVQLPQEIRVAVTSGGDDAHRQAFLASIDAVMNTVDFYDVLTPEAVYVGYNFTHRDLRRSAKDGVGLLTVDLWLMEVRPSASATFQSTAQPPVAGQQGIGNMQPQAPVPYVQQQFANGNWVMQ